MASVSKTTKLALTELDALWDMIDKSRSNVLPAVPKNAILVDNYATKYSVTRVTALRHLDTLAKAGKLRKALAYNMVGHRRMLVNVYMK